MPIKSKILIELSGGVDSAAAAYILKNQGYDCIGAMMKLHNLSSQEAEIENAKKICDKLNIPFNIIDLQKEFKKNIVDYFIDSYENAKTPNPCVECNRHMKFGIMFEIANKFGCDKLATGHYSQIIKKEDEHQLICAKDQNKDQSYFLHFLNQEQLSKTMFPLGKLSKTQVREIADEAGFDFKDKSESQDICFIENNDYKSFINKYSKNLSKPGKVIDAKGQKLGVHQGLINYTIGQRKGLGIASSEPLYVLSLDNKENTVRLGNKSQSYIKFVNLEKFSFISNKKMPDKFECSAKLRYRQIPQKCMANILDKNQLRLEFEEGISAVAPGQFAVLYNNNIVLGGGQIK